MCSWSSFLIQTQFSQNRCCSFFQALSFWLLESLMSKCKTLINNMDCMGCCNRERPLVVEVDEPSKGLKIQGKVVKKDGDSSDGLWSTSTCDMDLNIAIQFQSSNPGFDPLCGWSRSNSTQFVNHGLILWNQTRQQWREYKTRQQCQVPKPVTSWISTSTYDSLLSTDKLFPRPVPLKDMVHFLVEVWQEEGLYT